MKVLFVVPNYSVSRNLPEIFIRYIHPDMPLTGIAMLSAVLKQNAIDVKVVDMRLGYSMGHLFKVIKDYEPQVIGITMLSNKIEKAYKFINKIKEKYPETVMVCGGPHVSSSKKQVLMDCKADFAVKQEGEITFIEFLKQINQQKKTFSNIKGLIWRDGQNVVENVDMPLIQNLDALPMPDFSVFELEKYYGWQQGTIAIMTSRGCPYQCTYCAAFLGMGRQFRYRSAENVINEIEYWYNRGKTKFDISDDCFSLLPKRVEEICDKIISKNIKIEFRLFNGIRVDSVTKDLLKKMKEAGCTSIAYGVETGNENVLKKIKKGITLDKVQNAIKWSNELGIETTANFIIGHLEETYAEACDTIKLATSIDADRINFNNAIPYPGTELYEWVEKNARFIYPPKKYLNLSALGKLRTPLFETREFTAEQRKMLLKKGVDILRKRWIYTKLKPPFASIVYAICKYDFMLGLLEVIKSRKIVNKYIKPIFKKI